MRILMLGRWLPLAGRDGEGAREHYFARALAERHRLTIAFTTDEPEPTGAVAAIRAEFGDPEFAVVPRTWKCLTGALRLATGASCTVGYFRSEALSRRLRELARTDPWDLVFVCSSGMIPYALELGGGIPMIVDFGALDSEWWMHQAAMRAFPKARFFRTEATRLRLAEAEAARRATLCIAATASVSRTIAGVAPGARVTVIPDGIDPQHFAPLPHVAGNAIALILGPLRERSEVDVAEAFSRSVVAATCRDHPEARFVAIGRHSGMSMKRLSAIAEVSVVDTPDTVRPLLRDTVLAVAAPGADLEQPATVLAALALGLPVVSGSPGVFGGGPGMAIPDADGPAALSARVVQLLRQPALRAQIGSGGRAFAIARHSWSVASESLGAAVAAQGPRPASTAARTMLSP